MGNIFVVRYLLALKLKAKFAGGDALHPKNLQIADSDYLLPGLSFERRLYFRVSNIHDSHEFCSNSQMNESEGLKKAAKIFSQTVSLQKQK